MLSRLSIIIPCFNELATLQTVIKRVQALKLSCEKQLIIVDDASTDGSRELLKALGSSDLTILFHDTNLGKGAAIQTALKHSTGDYVLIQDADLEYNPDDIPRLVDVARERKSLVVYGSRNKDIRNAHLYPLFFTGSKVLTLLLNVLYRQRITDPETCYKLVQRDLLSFLQLRERGFGIEIEITAKIAKCGIPIDEASIHYSPRRFEDGKKIRSRDGIRALYLILKYLLWDSHFGPVDKLIRHLRTRQAERVLTQRGSKRLLDLGCGSAGYLGWRWRKRLSAYDGLDSDVPPGQILNLHFTREDVAKLPHCYKPNSFDAITGLAFLEHVNDPKQLLSDCYSILSPGGVLILTTPLPRAHIILSILAFLRLIDGSEIRDHKRYLRRAESEALVKAAGFTECHSKSFLFGFNSTIVATK